MRSLECWTSEPKRASPLRRWTSSVSAALSSASDDLRRQRLQASRTRAARASSAGHDEQPALARAAEQLEHAAYAIVVVRQRRAAATCLEQGAARPVSAAAASAARGERLDDSRRPCAPSPRRARRHPRRAEQRTASRPISARGGVRAAWWISSRRVAATSASPAALSMRSRSSDRSCWRTRPAMRTTTRPKRSDRRDVDDAKSCVPRAELLHDLDHRRDQRRAREQPEAEAG